MKKIYSNPTMKVVLLEMKQQLLQESGISLYDKVTDDVQLSKEEVDWDLIW